jgi:sortase A
VAQKNKKKKESQSKAPIFVFLILSVLGSAIMLYPSVSDYVNNRLQTIAIDTYRTELSNSAQEMIEMAFEQARRFNEGLISVSTTVEEAEARREEYFKTLLIGNSPVMAYIEIPKIDVHLPIYHGTEEAVLQAGVGHLEGTSLPSGGENTHAALSGHRGLPSAKLFTNLDKMQIGDMFVIHVLNQSLFYQVDQIDVVLPDVLNALTVEPGKDIVTLITCTPYAINTHRLLVRGSRIDGATLTDVPADRFIWQKQPLWFPWQFYLFLACAALAVCVKIALHLKHKKALRDNIHNLPARAPVPTYNRTKNPPSQPSDFKSA